MFASTWFAGGWFGYGPATGFHILLEPKPGYTSDQMTPIPSGFTEDIYATLIGTTRDRLTVPGLRDITERLAFPFSGNVTERRPALEGNILDRLVSPTIGSVTNKMTSLSGNVTNRLASPSGGFIDDRRTIPGYSNILDRIDTPTGGDTTSRLPPPTGGFVRDGDP